VPVDPRVLAAYAGRYWLREPNGGVNGIVRIEGACTFLQIPSQQAEYELIAISEDQFFIWGGTIVTFYRNASGEVDRVEYVLSGVTYEATRIP
jgi:hypothetical protein